MIVNTFMNAIICILIRKLMGQYLGSCSVDELNEITIQIEKSLTLIRSRKVNIHRELIKINIYDLS